MEFITSKTTNGKPVKIAYDDYGSGKPVILIHGWPLCKEMWEYQISTLIGNGMRVIAYDRRGFGKSDATWDGYDYDSLTGDLNELITQLKLTDVTLVSFSMGGGEVVRYMNKYKGANVTKVVLISSVTPYMLKSTDNPDGVPAETFEEMTEQMKNDRMDFLDGFGKTFFGVSMLSKPISTPLLQYYHMLTSMASPKATLECAKSFSQTDFRSEMKFVKVPTLIIHGSKDQTVPIDPTGKESAKLIPNNIFIIYDGAPHGLWYTERERLNGDLVAFINGTGKLSNEKDGELSDDKEIAYTVPTSL